MSPVEACGFEAQPYICVSVEKPSLGRGRQAMSNSKARTEPTRHCQRTGLTAVRGHAGAGEQVATLLHSGAIAARAEAQAAAQREIAAASEAARDRGVTSIDENKCVAAWAADWSSKTHVARARGDMPNTRLALNLLQW